MAIIDWKLLTSHELLGRLAHEASPREQARAFLQIADIVKSEGLHGVILDMDHAAASLPGDAADFAAHMLADALTDNGLERFALVDHGIQNPWWIEVVTKLLERGVAARRCDTVALAKSWFDAEGQAGAG
ncbi:MAG: hypothetical protein RKE49_08600 [Oceanicaulis sp.]